MGFVLGCERKEVWRGLGEFVLDLPVINGKRCDLPKRLDVLNRPLKSGTSHGATDDVAT